MCLAAAINPVIRENQILRNGRVNYRVPACGIGLVAAQNVTIEDNLIADNGITAEPDDQPVARGLRGGIVIVEVTPVRGFTFPGPGLTLTLPLPVTDFTDASGGSAVVVRGNEVSQPIGRALWIVRSHGAVTITGNTLESFGNPVVSDAQAAFTLCWSDNTANVTRPMEGACVEIYGFSKALDIEWSAEQIADVPTPTWVDSSGSLEDGGNTVVSQNSIRMSWDIVGGIATAVLISTLANALFESNSVLVNMYSQYPDPGGTAMSTFYDDILADSHEYSFIISSVYIAGFSTGHSSGNRISEGRFDALFSLTVGTVVAPASTLITDVKNAVSATSNVLNHSQALIDTVSIDAPQVQDTANLAVFRDESAPTGGYGVLGVQPAAWGTGRKICISNLSAP